MIELQERIDYYIGNTEYQEESPVDDGRKTFLFDGSQRGVIYEEDVVRLFANSNSDSIWFRCSDSRYTGPNYPVITKTRDTHNPESKGIIGSLEYSRHFGNINQVRKLDVDWKDKKDDMIWRGASTGIDKDDRICSRLDFVKKYFNKFDVGLSSPANKWYQRNRKLFEQFYKQPVSIIDQLKYKYIPVLDGNDKASCLNWILASTSVPLMPKPRFHSWLCEKYLEAGKHYVELKQDYSDLEEKLNWCINNDKECKYIGWHGAIFMRENFNAHQEELAEKLLMHSVDEIYSKQRCII